MSNVLTITRWNQYVNGIADRLIEVGEAAVSNLDKEMSIDFEEHFKFQELKGEAFVSGRIDEATAQAIYMALGENHGANDENGGWAEQCDTAEKVAITKLMSELLSIKIAKRTLALS